MDVEGMTMKGRPKQMWMDSVNVDLRESGLAGELSHNRAERAQIGTSIYPTYKWENMLRTGKYCMFLIALSRCNRVFTRRLRLCQSHTVYRREVRKGDREGPNRVEREV